MGYSDSYPQNNVYSKVKSQRTALLTPYYVWRIKVQAALVRFAIIRFFFNPQNKVNKMAQTLSPNNFEDAVARLETITQALQNPMLSLEDALAQYQEGVELVRFCQEKLAAAEQVLQKLDGDMLQPLELNDE